MIQKKGIDISHHQGDINFDELKGNIDFAMVRTSYGLFYEDRKYKQNILGLERINVPYGLYHFTYATNKEEAIKEANSFINLIKDYKPLYPVVLDIESTDKTSNLSKKELVDIAKSFCEIVENAGYYVIIYSSLYYLNNKLNDSSLDKYDKWVAEWSDSVTYEKPFGIWQYSSKGVINGININVDLNIAYKDYPKIIKEKNLNNYVKENNINYVVKKGDTLISIAQRYGMTYQELAKYNSIKDPNKININQVIKIPNSIEIKPVTYIVKKGDTLVSIAKKYNLNWKDIYNKNINIIGTNSNLIKVGQVLNLK